MLLAVCVTPLLAFVASQTQQRLYEASATVLLNAQNPTSAESLNLTASPPSTPDRYAATQARLARVGAVAAPALRAPGLPDRTAAALLANSSVSANPADDLLTFTVADPVPSVAKRLANAYARSFTAYRHQLDIAALSAALRGARRKLDEIVAAGDGESALFRRLEETQHDLEDLQTLQAAASSATLVGRADRASLEQPKTKRNVMLGVIVGLALGIALAFLREALDTRVHSADELRELLGVPLLGQVPKPARPLAPSKRVATLADPSGPSTEAFRILKTNLEISQLEHHAGSIAMTSASEDEGGSATAANLAVILARSDRRVILADLNLRHPSVARLFGLRERPGLTGVAIGVPLVDALTTVDVQPDRPSAIAGTLEVLTVGRPPADPGEFLVSSAVAEALEVLAERCDVLLIVTPPLLAAGDAMTIASHADALILVAEVDRVRTGDPRRDPSRAGAMPHVHAGRNRDRVQSHGTWQPPPALPLGPEADPQRTAAKRPGSSSPRSPLRSARSHLRPRNARRSRAQLDLRRRGAPAGGSGCLTWLYGSGGLSPATARLLTRFGARLASRGSRV